MLRAIWDFLMFWSRLSTKYNRIASDPELREKSVCIGKVAQQKTYRNCRAYCMDIGGYSGNSTVRTYAGQNIIKNCCKRYTFTA